MILRGTAIIMTPTFVRVEMKIIKNKMCSKFRNNVQI